ncbi:MAG TPA: hypothetical protein VNV25_19555, partial [Gemmatimonadaceae bacterium]|nr:hypothetical protein [Gemmatimonadaceae bacterium]
MAQLSKGTFAVPLPQLRLTQALRDQPTVYSGGGYIRQGPDGRLVLTMLDPTAPLVFDAAGVLGRLIPDDEYFMLDGHDLWNRRWQAPRVRLDYSWSVTGSGCEVMGKVPAIEAVEDDQHLGADAQLQLVFPDSLQMPLVNSTLVATPQGERPRFALDRADGSAAGLALSIRSDPTIGTIVELTGRRDAFGPNPETRLIETLQFAWARQLRPVAALWRSDSTSRTTLYGRKPGVQPSLEPAVPPNALPANDWWHLVDRYLTTVLDNPVEGFTHLGSEYNGILRSSDSGLGSQALIAAVAVEALL